MRCHRRSSQRLAKLGVWAVRSLRVCRDAHSICFTAPSAVEQRKSADPRLDRCAWRSRSAEDRRYDGLSLIRSRSYLQCGLACRELWAAGVREFHSGVPSAYYALLLRTKRLPARGRPASANKRQLAECEGDDFAVAVLDHLAPALAQSAAGPSSTRKAMLPDDIVGDPSGDGGPGELGSREGSVVGESDEAPDE